jgi:hypothetical protein
VAAILEILDVAALNEGTNFDVRGGFKSEWRAHAWEGNNTGEHYSLVLSFFVF